MIIPATSVGFDQVDYARRTLHRPLLPWQKFAVIHGGELLPDGRPRFRIVLVIVARQNGKTEIPVVLTPYWMFVDEYPMILGTSTKLEYSKETWDKTRKLIQRNHDLDDLRPAGRNWYVRGNNNIEMWSNDEKSRYKIAAANEEGGRSLTIDRAVADELRQHGDYSAWGAMEPAASPEDAQIWALSNAGDARSVVLNDLRAAALDYIAWLTANPGADPLSGPHDYRLCLLEWSAPEDADPTDEGALLQANPRVGYGRNLEDLVLEARRAVAKGGEALTMFKTEKMCIRVKILNPAIDPGAWLRCLDPGDLASVRSRVVLCVDAAPDGQHATLAAAAMLPDGRVRVEVVEAWEGAGCMDRLRAALPAEVARVRPQAVGWFPSGPAAALAANLADRNKAGTARRAWPPPGVTVAEIRGEISAACMGLDEQVAAGRVAHSADPLLDDQIDGAERLQRGDTWTFTRKGEGHVDAVYAVAGAVHLARTLPAPVGKPRLVVAALRDESA